MFLNKILITHPPTPPTPRPMCCGGLSQRPSHPVHPLSPAVLQPTSASRITLQSSIYRPGLSTNGLGCNLELYGMRILYPIQLASKCMAAVEFLRRWGTTRCFMTSLIFIMWSCVELILRSRCKTKGVLCQNLSSTHAWTNIAMSGHALK